MGRLIVVNQGLAGWLLANNYITANAPVVTEITEDIAKGKDIVTESGTISLNIAAAAETVTEIDAQAQTVCTYATVVVASTEPIEEPVNTAEPAESEEKYRLARRMLEDISTREIAEALVDVLDPAPPELPAYGAVEYSLYLDTLEFGVWKMENGIDPRKDARVRVGYAYPSFEHWVMGEAQKQGFDVSQPEWLIRFFRPEGRAAARERFIQHVAEISHGYCMQDIDRVEPVLRAYYGV